MAGQDLSSNRQQPSQLTACGGKAAFPLAGVRVASHVDESGELAAGLLADLGADVRRTATIDDDTDAVLLTGTPRTLREGDVEPSALLARHRRLIVVAISPFGLDGPHAEWRSCETIAQASGGLLFVNGHPGEPPLRVPGTPAYFSAGLHVAIGVVLALLERGRSGRGQLVDVSLQESAAALLEHVTGVFRDGGVISTRQGTLHWSGMFRVGNCRDGPVLLSRAGDWTALLEWLKADGAARDLDEPRWQDAQTRAGDGEHVLAVLDAWAARYRAEDLVAQAELRRLPFARVQPIAAAAVHPQLEARGFFADRSVVSPFRAAFAATTSIAAPVSAPPYRPSAASAASGVLSAIRVLDFTWVVAGPLATRVLADHGAEVIKIERTDTADDPPRGGALFANLNRGKRSVAINLADPRGRDVVRALAARSDVVIDNFSPRVLANWGLDHAALRARAPRLIALSLSAFGATGPCAQRVGYGPTVQAELGFTWHMRHRGGEPAGCGIALADTISGYAAALAIAAAVLQREATGVGRALDLAELEIAAAIIRPLLQAARDGVELPDAFGNDAPDEALAPHGVYRCRDAGDGRERWCAIAVRGEAEWRSFVATIGAPPWTGDAVFATARDRRRNASALDAHIAGWTRTREPDDVVAALQRSGIAAGTVADARDLAGDPQLAARGYWIDVPGQPILDGVVPRLSATPGRAARGGSALGADTDAVLREVLAMEQSALARLRADGVIR